MLSGPVQHLQPQPPAPDHVSSYLPVVQPRASLPVEQLLQSLGVTDFTKEELALADMWAGAFLESGLTPQRLDRWTWGVQYAGTYTLSVVDPGFWPALNKQDRIQFRPARTRIGVYAMAPRGTMDAGEYWVGATTHHPPKPLIYRPGRRDQWRPVGHTFRADTTNGFFSRLLHRALGATRLVPDTITVAGGRGRGHHVITTRNCPDCNSRPTPTLGAAGCMYPPDRILP